MNTKHIFPLITVLFIAFGAKAQSDSTLNKQVEVIKAYQPSISDAYKISSSPRIKDTINYSPTFEYNIHSQDIPVEKTINHLPVVQLGSAPREKSNTGYAKAALGNAWTPYAELFVNTAPSRNTDFGLQLQHFSSRPTIKLNNNLKVVAPNSDDLARIFIKNYFRKVVLDWEMSYQRQGYRYYGFPTDSLSYRQTEADTTNTLNKRQAQNIASARLNLKNIDSRSKIDYNLQLGYDYFWNATGQQSHHAAYNGDFSKKYRKFDILLDTKFDFHYQDSITNYFDNTVNTHLLYNASISPKIAIDKDIYQLTAGFNFGTLIGADSSLMWNISPNIYFAYHPIKGIMSLFAGANGGIHTNSYQQTAVKNPYINYKLEVMPSNELISLYGGFKGKISRTLSYLFDVDYSINKNNSFYYLSKAVTRTDTLVQNMFSVEYDDLNLLRFGGKLRYSSNSVTVDLAGNYYIYDAKTLTTLSHMPDFDISLNTSIQFSSRIKGKIDATVIGPRDVVFKTIKSTMPTTPPIISSEIYKLNTIIDLNLGVEYAYTKKLNFFLDARNALNSNYELWHGYNKQGLLILLGASYTF